MRSIFFVGAFKKLSPNTADDSSIVLNDATANETDSEAYLIRFSVNLLNSKAEGTGSESTSDELLITAIGPISLPIGNLSREHH